MFGRKKVNIGSENDADLITRLENFLTSNKAVRIKAYEAVVGSQHIEFKIYKVFGKKIHITFETYAGITIEGNSRTINEICKSLNIDQ